MRITLNGSLGSGKSTVGRMLSARLGIPYISTGAIFRDIGKISNLDALQTNLAAEDNAEIDFAVDKKISELDQTLNDFIIDSRMAWHFVKNATHIFLSVTESTAAERILNDRTRDTETYQNHRAALFSIAKRRQSEVRRYQNLYGVDIEDMRNYDLGIVTDDAQSDSIVELICRQLTPHRHKFWIPKSRLVPMISIRDAGGISFGTRIYFSEIKPLQISLSDNFGFYFGGARPLVDALFFELPLIPYIPTEPEFLSKELKDVFKLAKSTLRRSDLYDWESLAGTKFTFENQISPNDTI